MNVKSVETYSVMDVYQNVKGVMGNSVMDVGKNMSVKILMTHTAQHMPVIIAEKR